MTTVVAGLHVLVVDDELPALDELTWLLGRDERIGRVQSCSSATDALRMMHQDMPDAVFLDIAMPGLNGLELAEVLTRFKQQPALVFVTAHAEHAVAAFALEAVDYLLKPLREDRLHEAVRRIVEAVGGEPTSVPDNPLSDSVAVELGGVTRFVARADILYVEAQGDYARLHTAEGSHLVRVPIGTLEDRWGESGFVRIHRSLLIALAHVDEVRITDGRCRVVVAGQELQVSRRQTSTLRDLLRRTP